MDRNDYPTEHGFTTREAERCAGLTKELLGLWVKRGHLPFADDRPRGKAARYSFDEVVALRATRQLALLCDAGKASDMVRKVVDLHNGVPNIRGHAFVLATDGETRAEVVSNVFDDVIAIRIDFAACRDGVATAFAALPK